MRTTPVLVLDAFVDDMQCRFEDISISDCRGIRFERSRE
jgi:hypothetical protein